MKIISKILSAFLLTMVGCNSLEESPKQEVKNIILMIGHSSTIDQVQGDLVGDVKNLNLLRATVRGFSKISGPNKAEIRLDADASVLSIGKSSNFKTLGLDSNGVAHPNIVELASYKGLSTGLITSNSTTNAVPASFIVHSIDKNQFESIAVEYLNSPIDLIIGGGLEYFTLRSDGANLIQRFKNKGFSFYNDIEKASKASRLIVLLKDSPNQPAQISENQMLISSSELALQSLSMNSKGFFLLIDGSKTDQNHDRSFKNQNKEMIDFDKSVGVVFDFADKNPGTLVIVMNAIKSNEPTDGKNNEPLEKFENLKNNAQNESVVSVYAYGALANTFNGTYESTEVFYKMVGLLKLAVK